MLFVRPDTPLTTVVDNDGVLVGVISIFDVLRHV